MVHLDEELGLVEKVRGRPIFLFLDYDGTLTPISETPESATLTPSTRDCLERLSLKANMKIFVVSGRSLLDVKQLIGVERIQYFGNHGFETEGSYLGLDEVEFPSFRRVLEEIKSEIEGKIAAFPGAFVEDKGLTLSVHYRKVEAGQEAAVRNFLAAVVERRVANKEVRVTTGKKVLEVRPFADWDKGKLVRYILKRDPEANRFPIYMGDDVTDEDAFLALKDEGLTIFVGPPKESAARYYLRDPREVAGFLEYLDKHAGQCPG